MFERFTERARQVIVLTQEEARTLRHGYLGTEHLLMGIIREEHGLGAEVLRNMGISPQVVRDRIIEIVGRGEVTTDGQIPFTPRCKKALELALREALSMGHNYIGTEHVLLGLVREGEGVGMRILRERGIPAEEVRLEVQRRLTGGHRLLETERARIMDIAHHDLTGPEGPEPDQRVALNAEEEEIMDHIDAAMRGIDALGYESLSARLELKIHVHGLRGFVTQHMLRRLNPDIWGKWFT